MWEDDDYYPENSSRYRQIRSVRVEVRMAL